MRLRNGQNGMMRAVFSSVCQKTAGVKPARQSRPNDSDKVSLKLLALHPQPAATPIESGRGWPVWADPNEQRGVEQTNWGDDIVPVRYQETASAPWAFFTAVPSVVASSAFFLLFPPFPFFLI